jgi:hypothetical protein
MRILFSAWLLVVAAAPAFADGLGLKPGLWEMRIVRHVMDGKDMSSQLSDAQARMQQALANMPPEQRDRVASMMKGQGGPASGGNGTVRMCISPEMASRDKPIVDRDGRCEPATVTHSGDRTTFEFNCTSNGVTSTGKGQATKSADGIATQVDLTTHSASGETHVMHNETEMKFIGTDCGDVKPLPTPKTGQ